MIGPRNHELIFSPHMGPQETQIWSINERESLLGWKAVAPFTHHVACAFPARFQMVSKGRDRSVIEMVRKLESQPTA